MLTRRREQVGLILGLLVLNALLVWDLHRLWKGYQSRIEWVYARAAQRPAATPVSPLSHVAETQAFTEISSRNLFSPQRATRHPEEKEAQAPELPLLFGTMDLGEGRFALMAPGGQTSSASKRVLPGEEIGGYKLVSIAGAQVVVTWQDKNFTIDVSESARRVPRVVERTVSAGAPARTTTPSASASSRVTTVESATPSASNPLAAGAQRGKFNPAGTNAPPGAPPDAPPGTVMGGKQKVVKPTPFGDQVFWVDVEPTQNSTGQTQEKKVQ